MCRLLLNDGLKAACTLFRILDFGFWILDFGFWILDFGFRLADRCRLLSRFAARMKRGAKHRPGSFCDCLRHGRRVACNVDMTAAQRHAHRPDTLSAIQKAACTLFRVGGAGCFFKFAANLSPLPRERVRVRAFSDGANFNFCMAAGLPSPLPSPTGEGVGLRLPTEGGNFKRGYGGATPCRPFGLGNL